MTDVSLALLNKRIALLEEDRGHWKSRALAAERNQTPQGGQVWPSRTAKAQGFDKPGKLRWPGIVVHSMSKGSQRLVQFLVWDIDRCQYVLKTWVPVMLKEEV